MHKDDSVKLLWTGGWDSTFRLLELLLIKQRTVQPYYVIDSARPSTGVELERRDRIKRILIERDPKIKDLFLPTIYYGKAEIKPNDELSKNYKNILIMQGLGDQHHWLALFADEEKINSFEICNHKNDPAATIIEPFASKVVNDDTVYYRVSEDCGDVSVYNLFKYFRFPLLSMTKPEIGYRAREYGFFDLMVHTWFCHTPLGHPPMAVRPCGTCNTCIYTINTLGIWRIPYSSRIRYYFSRLLRPQRFSILAKRQG